MLCAVVTAVEVCSQDPQVDFGGWGGLWPSDSSVVCDNMGFTTLSWFRGQISLFMEDDTACHFRNK